MKRLTLLLLLLLLSGAVAAQSDPVPTLQVLADSALIRAAPTEDAAYVASVFANDNLVATGRNIDGTWLEVRRPSQQQNLGWIARNLVLLTFDLGRLPMTDTTTGLTGPVPVTDTGYAVLTIDDLPLYAAPDRDAQILADVPVFLTLPVIARTPDLQWLQVNFRGTTGWVQQFLTRSGADLSAIPISASYASDSRYAAVATIPPEQQLAQVERLLNYIAPIRQTTADVAFYWQQMSQGETVECRPPAGNYAYFVITPQDIVELPELRQQERLLTQAVDDINASIEAMRPCGVYLPRQIRQAYADALNAGGIFDRITTRMDALRMRIDPDSVEQTGSS